MKDNFDMGQIVIALSEDYKKLWKPLNEELLLPYNLPSDVLDSLTHIGLPLNTSFEFNANISITFCEFPTVKRYPYHQHDYLFFASMEEMGELSIDLHSKGVFQYVDTSLPRSLVNTSLEKFMECLGLWLSFYPQLQNYMREMYQENPCFSLFENGKILKLMQDKIKEIDPYSMKYQKFFWRRMCEPDIF